MDSSRQEHHRSIITPGSPPVCRLLVDGRAVVSYARLACGGKYTHACVGVANVPYCLPGGEHILFNICAGCELPDGDNPCGEDVACTPGVVGYTCGERENRDQTLPASRVPTRMWLIVLNVQRRVIALIATPLSD